MPRLALLTLLTLAACGAAGPPEPPKPGVSVTGQAQMGVVVR